MKLVEIKNVRGYVDINGTAYINLEDTARGLGFVERNKNGKESVRWRRLKMYLTGIDVNSVIGGSFSRLNLPEYIPENLFYKLCMKANNDTARRFQNLVCDEILPQIRKTGGYIPSGLDDNEEDILAKALMIAQKTIESRNQQITELKQKIDKNRAKLDFAETIESSSEGILIREYAKVLGNRGIFLGEKKLYRWLREKGFILKNSTEPSQRAVEMGLFKSVETIIKTVNKDIISRTTKITGKGQVYFMGLLAKEMF